MTPYFEQGGVTIYNADCVEVMRGMPAGSVDAIVCDPPYALEFMGQEWDTFGRNSPPSFEHSMQDGFKGFKPLPRPGGLKRAGMLRFQEWSQGWATEALRVLAPGGYLLAFGGTRTYHRLACAVEDAGFEIRDMIAWIYGTGFPKGKSCLKPAHEPIVMARKPGGGRALNIDDCRIGLNGEKSPSGSGDRRNGAIYAQDEWTRTQMVNGGNVTPPAGRWPANLMLDETAAALLDAMSGERPVSGSAKNGRGSLARPGGIFGALPQGTLHNDKGGASRFFYVAKASRAERNAGLEGMPERTELIGAAGHRINPMTGRAVVDIPRANFHPTVKPIKLMDYLIRLVTPPGGVVLDPFLGSGTTLVAARNLGHRAIGVEMDADYAAIAAGRLTQLALELSA